MSIRQKISDAGIGLIGGYVGTQVMERVSMKLYELEPEEDRKREEEVRPGPPFEIAARRTTEALGIELSEEQIQTLALCARLGEAGPNNSRPSIRVLPPRRPSRAPGRTPRRWLARR